jgi:hypothetical protein
VRVSTWMISVGVTVDGVVGAAASIVILDLVWQAA